MVAWRVCLTTDEDLAERAFTPTGGEVLVQLPKGPVYPSGMSPAGLLVLDPRQNRKGSRWHFHPQYSRPLFAYPVVVCLTPTPLHC